MMSVKWYALVALLLLTGTRLYGQSFSSLKGIVHDPNGRAIAQAELTLIGNDTGAKRTTLSGSDGHYTFSQITPGTYQITCKAASFTVTTINKLELLVNTPATVNIALALGAITETVTVEGGAALVNTTDASLGNAVNTEAILQLPLEARNPASLLALQAGVTYFGAAYSGNDTTIGYLSSANRLNGSVNGSKPDQNNITLDGTDVNDQNARSPLNSVLRVTLDSVQEFRTTTLNPTADQGRGSGAQIALVTKSGGNSFRGSLYEFHRNTATSANSFFNNLSGLPRQKLNRNVFGASLGGPIRKDRVFFFVNYEGRRDDSEETAVRLVPTATLRQGNVRYLNTSGGVSTLTPAQLLALDPAAKGANPAVLAALNQYPAANDSTQGDGFNTAGYRFVANRPLSQNTYIARLDYTLDAAAKNQVFIRGNLQGDKADQLPQFPGQASSSSSLDHSKGIAAGWTSVLRPNLLSTFRYGLTRYGREDTGVLNSPYVAFAGLATLNATTTGLARVIPVHQFSEDLVWTKGAHNLGFGGVARIIRNQSVNYANAWPSGLTAVGFLERAGQSLDPANLSPAYTTPYRAAAVNLLGPVTRASATYQYDLNGNVQPFGQPSNRNFGAEEYELYATDAWRITKALTINYGLRYSLAPPIYETNGYQVSPTRDLGDWFEQRAALANAGRSQAEAGTISYVLADSPGGRSLYDTQKKNFSPRLSLVYSPQGESGLSKFFFGGPGKTSIRAGAGMYYDLFGISLMRNFDNNAPGLTTRAQSPFGRPLATHPRFSGYGVLPAGVLPAAPRGGFPYTPPSGFFEGGFAITGAIDQRIKQPYSINLNFSIGREFSRGWFVQGSYVGRLARRSLLISDLAQTTNLRDPKSGQTYYEAINALAAQARLRTPASAIKPQPFFENLYSKFAGGGLTATQQIYNQTAQYYPTDITSTLFELEVFCFVCGNLGQYSMFNGQYSALFAYRSAGRGDYHAMQWTVRKRLSGLQLDANYTFAKSIDLTSAPESDFTSFPGSPPFAILLNGYTPSLSRAVSDFDIRHSVNGYAIYQLPFGKGQRFGAGLPGTANALLGGWQLGGIFNVTSGLPRGIINGGSWPTSWSFWGWATATSAPPPSGATRNAPGIDGVSGPNVFADPKAARGAFDYSYAGQVGNRNVIRGDGFMSIDLSLSKRFIMPYKETHSLQFRAEAFNFLNSVRFDIGTASLDIGATGTFGKYSSLLTSPRVMQFGVRYEF